jgi:hypothetical protein
MTLANFFFALLVWFALSCLVTPLIGHFFSRSSA